MRIAIGLISVALVFAASAWAQESATVSLSNGIQLRIYARASDGSPVRLKTELEPASGNSFYRMYRDENGLVVFTYELSVERTPDGDQVRATARPAGDEFAARFPNADGGKPAPTLPAARESGLLSSGGRFAIVIPTDPGLMQEIIDTVQVRIARPGAPRTEEAESQASAALRFAALKVAQDGAVIATGAEGAIVAGRYVMFYIPGHGGYFFSTDRVERRAFVQVGAVDGTRLRFTIDGGNFECESEEPILVHAERGQIWVFHDPAYRPSGNWTKLDPRAETREQFFTAGSDSLNWWLP
jgi:hypothetical protein